MNLLVFPTRIPGAPPMRPWSHLGELENVRGVFCFPGRGGCWEGEDVGGDVGGLCATAHQQLAPAEVNPCISSQFGPITVVYSGG